MIHYNGLISRRPGRVACDVASAQATSERWNAVDCDRCKTSIVGLTIERHSPAPEAHADRLVVEAVEPYRVGLAAEAGAELAWSPLHGLDDWDIDANAPMWRAVA